MRNSLLLIALVMLINCKSGTKDNTVNDEKKDSTTAVMPKSDTTISAPIGKIDIETFGDIKIGQPHVKTIEALGEPDSKSTAVEWGADGLMHEDWTYRQKDLSLI